MSIDCGERSRRSVRRIRFCLHISLRYAEISYFLISHILYFCLSSASLPLSSLDEAVQVVVRTHATTPIAVYASHHLKERHNGKLSVGSFKKSYTTPPSRGPKRVFKPVRSSKTHRIIIAVGATFLRYRNTQYQQHRTHQHLSRLFFGADTRAARDRGKRK